MDSSEAGRRPGGVTLQCTESVLFPGFGHAVTPKCSGVKQLEQRTGLDHNVADLCQFKFTVIDSDLYTSDHTGQNCKFGIVLSFI